MPNQTTIDNFNRDHASEGGVEKLIEMYKAGAATSDMAEVFKLSTKQVNYYLKAIIGDNYLRYPWRRMSSDQR